MRIVRQWLIRAAALWAACSASIAVAPAPAAGPATVTVTSELTTTGVRTQESSLADVIADALKSAAKSDAAFVPASWFVDATIAQGSVTPEQFLQALDQRTDTILVMKLTGDQIRRGLEHGLALYPQKNPAFLQVSGIALTIDPSPDATKRVVSVKVGGSPIADATKYTVAMPSPLANGALAYSKVWARSDIDRSLKTTVEDAVNTYLAAQKTVGGKGEDRIVVRK